MDYNYPQFKKQYEVTYVWLRKNVEEAHFFYCCRCQNAILRFQGSVVAIIPAGINAMSIAVTDLMAFPLEAKCSNRNCIAKYIFEGMTF